ncbi:unnamed protein product, partial [marine sediment metagenome]
MILNFRVYNNYAILYFSMKIQTKPHKVNIITLGCAKNLVDSEVLMKQLESNQIEIVQDSDKTDAKTVIINTCGFIEDAKEESIETILQFVRAKEGNEIERLFVI